ELLEEDPRDLLRRAEHELLARELVGPRLQLLDPLRQARRDLAHPVRVDADARVLHRRQHLGQRQPDAPAALDAAAVQAPVAPPRAAAIRSPSAAPPTRPVTAGRSPSTHCTSSPATRGCADGTAASSRSTRCSSARNSKRRNISASCERSGGLSTSLAGSQ